MSATLLDCALWYARRGFHPIPCEVHGKRPLLDEWLEYQTRQPTLVELTSWWTKTPTANLALVVGRGIVVVDLDGPLAGELLAKAKIELPADAPRVKTGRGEHVYLRLPPGRTAKNRVGFLASTSGPKSQVDLRADGGYVLAPPSIHPNGQPYRWLTRPIQTLAQVPLVPDSLLNFKVPPPREESTAGHGWVAQAMLGVPEGLRDDTCARLAGYFLAKQLPEDVVVAILASFAQRCTPPLSMRDVHRVVTSIGRAEGKKPPGEDAGETVQQKVAIEHIAVSVAKALDEIQNPREGLELPFSSLRMHIVGGLRPGELIYLGARPGIGKTAFALELARSAAKRGKQVLVVSREMLAAALARRMLSQEGRLNAAELKVGKVDLAIACEVGVKLSSLPIWITDSARALREVEEALLSVPKGVQLLIVDYLQLVEAPHEIRERRLQVDHVSQGLKALALRHQVPVVCLSSLARPPSGTNPAPTLASLRESGELEHDADIVIFLHRELNSDNRTLAIVAKNRDGATGTAQLTFRPEFVSFHEERAEGTL